MLPDTETSSVVVCLLLIFVNWLVPVTCQHPLLGMIEVAGNIHMSNTSPADIRGVGDEIHIKSCIASYQLPPNELIASYQQYNVVLKSTSATVPAILYDFCTQLLFNGKLVVHANSVPPTILVEHFKWQVHRGHFPLAPEFKETHTFGTAYVIKVHMDPVVGCVDFVEVVDPEMKTVSVSFALLEWSPGCHVSSVWWQIGSGRH